MEFYSERSQHVHGPVMLLPQKGSFTGGSGRPMNSYAILRTHGCILFDAPFSWIMDTIEQYIGMECAPRAIVLSHRDLAGSGDAFEQIVEHYELPILIHPADRHDKKARHLNVPLDDVTSGEGARELERAEIEMIHIPGHSPGSIMLYVPDEGGVLLAGDSAVGPGPEQDDQSPRLQRPIGADEDERFIATWKEVVDTRPIAAVLPLHGAYYRREDLGEEAFARVVANIWEGEPMDPRSQ